MPVDTMQILMLGNIGSGKTTYIASAFEKLKNGVQGFSINTDDSTAKWFHRLSQMIKSGDYPNATDRRDEHLFKLYYGHHHILNFKWIDYNGGVISDINPEELMKDITNSQGVLIFLEAKALYENRILEHKFNYILSLIHNHMSNCTSMFSVIVLLTKYDQLPCDVKCDMVTRNINGFLEAAQKNDHIYSNVVPVSCTSRGFFNVDLPLLDILDSGLRLEYNSAVITAKKCYDSADEHRKQSGLFEIIGNTILRRPTQNQQAAEMTAKGNKHYDFFKSLENPIINLRRYIKNYKVQYPNGTLPNVKSGITNNNTGFLDL